MKIDNCIVGLGNPGAEYFGTRHNIGFAVIDRLAEFFKIESFIPENNYLYYPVIYHERSTALIKPLTYMNRSGLAVKEFCAAHSVKPENTLIVYDDINLDFGVLRIRPGGSDGGQNGIKSVIYELETEEVPRLRIGINGSETEKLKSEGNFDLAAYVLSGFNDDELKHIDKILEASKKAVLHSLEAGIKGSMNIYNKRVPGITDISGENNTNQLTI